MGKSLDGKNLGKGITQRKDGLYQGAYYINGTRKFLYDKNLRKLKQRIKEAENYVEEELDFSVADYTVNDIYELWLKNRLLKNELKESTKMSYISNYNNIIKPKLGNKKIRCIRKIEIENFINECIDERIGTFESIKSVLLHLFDYAIDYQIIRDNPAKGIKAYKKNIKKIEILTIEDQELIIKTEKNQKYKNLTMFALNTGLRISEIFGLELSDIDFDNKILYVNKQIKYEKNYGETDYKYSFTELKSKKSKRIIPLNKWAVLAIENQINYRKDTKVVDEKFKDILFLNKDGYPMNKQNVYKHYTSLYKKLEGKLNVTRIHPHMFRHTFATMCLDADMNTRVIQSLLGHSSDKITEIYAHVTKNKITSSLINLNINYNNIDFKYDNLN